MALQLTEHNFEEEVLKSSIPVLVDFWATWCGPCKMISPIIDTVAVEMAGQAKVGKVDVDASPDLASRYGVRNIPTLLFFKDGKVVKTQVGACSKADILASLRACL